MALRQFKMKTYKSPLYRFPNKNIVRYQQTHSGGEIKGFDVTNSTTTTTNTVVAWPLNLTTKLNCVNLITVGSSSWNRIGRKVSLKSIRLRGYLGATGFNSDGTGAPQYFRMTLVYDKQPNGALPVAGDVFLDQSSVSADASITTTTSGLNLNNRDRFEVIWDKQLILPPVNTSTGTAGLAGFVATADLAHFDWYAKLGNRETHFKADSSPAVIGDIATGSLVFITQGSDTAGAEPYNLLASIRVRYSDL